MSTTDMSIGHVALLIVMALTLTSSNRAGTLGTGLVNSVKKDLGLK